MSNSSKKIINRRTLHRKAAAANARHRIQWECRARIIADGIRQQAKDEAEKGYTFIQFETDPDWGYRITKMVIRDLRRSHLRPSRHKEKGEKGGDLYTISWW